MYLPFLYVYSHNPCTTIFFISLTYYLDISKLEKKRIRFAFQESVIWPYFYFLLTLVSCDIGAIAKAVVGKHWHKLLSLFTDYSWRMNEWQLLKIFPLRCVSTIFVLGLHCLITQLNSYLRKMSLTNFIYLIKPISSFI